MDIVKTRHRLHALAELSGQEQKTAEHILQELQKFSPAKIWTEIAGHGVLAKFEFPKKGKKVLLRADLDALEIPETISLPYSSQHSGKSHKCGHDGHMTMVLSVINHLKTFSSGELYLFFQPAEENGQGAKEALHTDVFQNLKLDYVFSLHNLPGEPLGKVILCEDIFSCSSVGVKIKITGKSSHAAEPDKAVSPYPLVHELHELCNQLSVYEEGPLFRLATLTHAKLGEESFGITPGEAVVFITLRALKDEAIEEMKVKIQSKLGEFKELRSGVEEFDDFPSLRVDPTVVKEMISVLEANNIDHEVRTFPFRWSEDFGHFTRKYKGVYFGLGSGEDCFPLHHPHYDFPDKLLLKGEEVYLCLLKHFLT